MFVEEKEWRRELYDPVGFRTVLMPVIGMSKQYGLPIRPPRVTSGWGREWVYGFVVAVTYTLHPWLQSQHLKTGSSGLASSTFVVVDAPVGQVR